MVDVRGPPRPPVRVEAQRRFSGLTEWLAARDAVPPHASADAHFSAVLRARRFFLLDGSPGRVEKRVLGDFSAIFACSAVFSFRWLTRESREESARRLLCGLCVLRGSFFVRQGCRLKVFAPGWVPEMN